MNFEQVSKIEKVKTELEKLEEIELSDYSKIEDSLREWLETKEDLPEEFWKKIKNIDKKTNLKAAVSKIIAELLFFINQETPHSQDVVKVILVRRECGDEWILIRTTVLCGTLYA